MKISCLILFAFTISLSAATAAAPFSIESKADGAWSDPASWQPERVPGAGDRVHIAPGHQILYDVKSATVIAQVHVEGALVFARDRDTELDVAMLWVGGKMAGSHSGVADVHGHEMAPLSARLEVGTPDAPIPPEFTARIRLHYIDGLDEAEAPLITCRPGGCMDFQGAPMSRTWLDLADQLRAVQPRARRPEPAARSDQHRRPDLRRPRARRHSIHPAQRLQRQWRCRDPRAQAEDRRPPRRRR